MGRTVAVIWHASFSIAAGVLYFFFVLPRMPELLGDTSPTLGTVLRIVTGALIGLAALPVVFTLLRTRRPEFGTPKLALSLRTVSIALHVLAGVLIIGAAISEIWLSLDSVGQWLFGIYGAAAALTLLGALAFYLAFVVELPPPPPKPLKVKERKGRRGRKGESAEESAEVAEDTESSETTDDSHDTTVAEETPAPTAEVPDTAATDAAPEESGEMNPPTSEKADTDDAEAADGKLQNRRPAGKGSAQGRRRRTRGGVAVED
ncbi:hypothetical protein [Mycolicibacterium pyrenivorans]|uniref:hypothetical protein n=1 Tax=Mycolicibacterium pyrenivorans TaxID=187102 RepID=UPI0021F3ACA5|nr:hypothetical protein [Mycolicibacterium pyrenivorans]MCV7153004.1 hypothetical protein [Mycolicibacterium pyrenivorans]